VLTKEEIEAEKANLKAIDARPIKKVMEAKARKRKRLQVRREPSIPLAALFLSLSALCLQLCRWLGLWLGLKHS